MLRQELREEIRDIEGKWENGLEKDLVSRQMHLSEHAKSLSEALTALDLNIEKTRELILVYEGEAKKSAKSINSSEEEIESLEASLEDAAKHQIKVKGRLLAATAELKNSKMPPVSPPEINVATDNLRAAEKVCSEALQDFNSADKDVEIAKARVQSEEKRKRQIDEIKSRFSDLLDDFVVKKDALER